MSAPIPPPAPFGDPERRSLLITFGAFAFSPVIYVVVLWILETEQAGVARGADSALLRSILYGGAFLAFVAAIVWVRFRLSGSATPIDSATPRLEPARFRTALILGCALAEAPAVLGFVLAMTGGRFSDMLLLSGVSLATFGAVLAPALFRYLNESSSRGGPISRS